MKVIARQDIGCPVSPTCHSLYRVNQENEGHVGLTGASIPLFLCFSFLLQKEKRTREIIIVRALSARQDKIFLSLIELKKGLSCLWLSPYDYNPFPLKETGIGLL